MNRNILLSSSDCHNDVCTLVLASCAISSDLVYRWCSLTSLLSASLPEPHLLAGGWVSLFYLKARNFLLWITRTFCVGMMRICHPLSLMTNSNLHDPLLKVLQHCCFDDLSQGENLKLVIFYHSGTVGTGSPADRRIYRATPQWVPCSCVFLDLTAPTMFLWRLNKMFMFNYCGDNV